MAGLNLNESKLQKNWVLLMEFSPVNTPKLDAYSSCKALKKIKNKQTNTNKQASKQTNKQKQKQKRQ